MWLLQTVRKSGGSPSHFRAHRLIPLGASPAFGLTAGALDALLLVTSNQVVLNDLNASTRRIRSPTQRLHILAHRDVSIRPLRSPRTGRPARIPPTAVARPQPRRPVRTMP
jgi:hypothetical protein